jgi:S-(hydroxymethyl)glutathione dehydrogenase/alcohol dehydrogenase
MKARAAVLKEVKRPLELEELTVGTLEPDEVLISVHACGVCRSDRNVQMTGEMVTLPVILGHEAAGVVEDVGASVSHLKPGHHVIISQTPSCGVCPACVREKPYLCVGMNPSPGEGRLSLDGKGLNRYMSIGGFAERAVVHQGQAIPIDAGMPLEVACLIGCGVMTGYGAAVRTGGVAPGMTVAVFGCGGVGLSAVMGARLAGAAKVIAVDRVPMKLEIAERVGATHCVAGEEPVSAVRKLMSGGVDVAIEAVGATDVMLDAMKATRPGGTTVVVGVPSFDDELRFSPFHLLLDRTLRGSLVGSEHPAHDFPYLVDLYLQGRLPLDDLITGTFPLDEVNIALDALDEGATIRSVILTA